MAAPCVFCAIVAGEAPAVIVAEDETCVAFLDIRPVTRGHTLVVPRVHTADLTDTPAATLGAMVALGRRVSRAARASGLRADGTNLALNDGAAAFQTVFHVHLHVVPRQRGDRVSFVKGLLWRRDPDRESTGRLLREALAAPNVRGRYD